MKQCSKCKEWKSLDSFNRRSEAEGRRLQSSCKECKREKARAYVAKYRAAHPERWAECNRKARVKHYWKRPYAQLTSDEKRKRNESDRKTRAKKKGLYLKMNREAQRRYRRANPAQAWRCDARFRLRDCSEAERETFAEMYVKYRSAVQTLNKQLGRMGWNRKDATVNTAPSIEPQVDQQPNASDSSATEGLPVTGTQSEHD